MNLIRKLINKLSANLGDKSKNRLIALILSLGIGTTGVGMAGCNNTNITPDGPGSGIEAPANPEYSKYSQILQNVLNDDYYLNLISVDNSWTGSAQDAPSYKNPKYNAIPYGFLEDEGYNIDQIKNNQVASKSDMYTIGNDLYIELRVETKATKNYYTNYVLKYNLTDKELHELDVLFTNIGNGKTTFYRAPFFVQELSYSKTPEIVSKSYISVDSINAFEDYADSKEYIAKSTTGTYLGAIIDQNNNATHTYQIHKRLTSASTKGSMQIGQIEFTTFGSGMEYINSVNVQTSTKTSALLLLGDAKNNFEQSIQTVNYYNCENASFDDIFAKDSTKELLTK